MRYACCREEFWDQFQSIPENSDGTNSCARLFETLSKVFKVVLYIALFLLILAGLLFSRLALLALAGNVGSYQKQLANVTSTDEPFVSLQENGTTATTTYTSESVRTEVSNGVEVIKYYIILPVQG